MAEQLICNQQVVGSIPITSSTNSTIQYGQIPERPKGADCKSADSVFGGSNPPLPTKKQTTQSSRLFFVCIGGLTDHSALAPWCGSPTLVGSFRGLQKLTIIAGRRYAIRHSCPCLRFAVNSRFYRSTRKDLSSYNLHISECDGKCRDILSVKGYN